MATTGHPRSRMFKVSASLLLSTAYFVAAIGVWMVQQGHLNSSADTTSTTCTPIHQETDTFDPQHVVGGSVISLPTGWTADSGTITTGLDRNISSADTGDAWLVVNGRIQRSISATRKGQVAFHLASHMNYSAIPATQLPPFDVTLLTKTGTPLALRINPNTQSAGFLTYIAPGGVQYRDPLTGDYKSVEYAEIPILPGGFGVPPNFAYAVGAPVSHDNTNSVDMTFTVSWDGTNFTLDSPNAVIPSLTSSSKSKQTRFAQNDPTDVIGIALGSGSFTNGVGIAIPNLMVQTVTHPAGSVLACLTGITPSSANPGDTVTLNGNQFEQSGMKVTLTDAVGKATTVDPASVTLAGSAQASTAGADKLTFVVPAGLVAGAYTVGLTTSAGAAQQTQTLTVTAPAVSSTGGLALTVAPTTGPAPLAVSAKVSQLVTTNLLRSSFTEINDVDAAADAHLTKTQAADGTIDVTGAPSASSQSTNKCWLYDLDQNKINQLQWKQTVPDHVVITAKLSWQHAASNGMQLGGIGLIDKDGLLQNFAGHMQGNQGSNGVIAAATRDYQKLASTACNQTSTVNTKNEWTSVDPAQDWATPNGSWKWLASPSGSTTVKIQRDGMHAILFVGDAKVREMDMQGDVAGVAFAVAGFPSAPFGDVKLESLTLLNLTDQTAQALVAGTNVTWEFGDGSQPVTNTNTTMSHTYATAGTYNLKATVNGQTMSQAITATTAIKTDSTTNSGSGITDTGSGPGGTATASAVANTTRLITSGGSLGVNLGIAALLAMGTTYFLLRRKEA